jgi:hypothetical protein
MIHSVVHFSGVASQYFALNQSSGELVLGRSLNNTMTSGMTFNFTAVAKDGADPQCIGATNVMVTVLGPDSGPPRTGQSSTPPWPCFLCTTGGLAVFVLLLACLAAIVGVLVCTVWHFWPVSWRITLGRPDFGALKG